MIAIDPSENTLEPTKYVGTIHQNGSRAETNSTTAAITHTSANQSNPMMNGRSG